MKLLIITSIKECREVVSGIFSKTGIEVFSVAEIVGFKEGAPSDVTRSWFGAGGDAYDSVMLFSFTDQQKAEMALSLIKAYNKKEETAFPIRGFILPVEQFDF